MTAFDSHFLVYVCGCNGAGKSTFIDVFFRKDFEPKLTLLDPDKIACEYNLSEIESGKKIITLIKKLLDSRQSFVKESTLTSKLDFKIIDNAKKLGYQTFLCYIGVESPDVNDARIKGRVLAGVTA